jgi:hypothetical protein
MAQMMQLSFVLFCAVVDMGVGMVVGVVVAWVDGGGVVGMGETAVAGSMVVVPHGALT